MKTLVAILFLFSFAQVSFSELPPKPPLKEIVNNSKLIIQAEQVNVFDVDTSINLKYRIITFRVHDIYKGIPHTDPLIVVQGGDKTLLGPLINVIILKQGTISRGRIPNYKNKQKYILFLTDEVLESLYMRSHIDARYEETPWSETIEKEIQSMLSSPDNQGDDDSDPNGIQSSGT